LFSPTGQIVGSVIGQQLEGVSIGLTGPNGYKAKATTSANGQFQIDGLAAGSYTLSASGPSLIFDIAQRSVTLAKAESLQGVSFVNIIDRGSANVQVGSAPQSLSEGYYSSIQITGDGNLTSPNILEGVTIFGVTGSANLSAAGVPTGGNALAGHLLAGRTAYAGGQFITGTIPTQQASPHASQQAEGIYPAFDLQSIDSDLKADNIVAGANIFGVTGTAPNAGITTGTSGFLYEGRMIGGTLQLEHE
jgi:hypothetical protein